MIESKLSSWIAYKTLAYSIVGFLCGMPIYLKPKDRNETEILWWNLFIVLFAVIVIAFLLYRVTLKQKHHVVINKDKIIINYYLTDAQYEFDHCEIKGMSWQKVNRTYGATFARGPTISTNDQAFSIYFKDGSELQMSKADYDNYNEMVNWFFGYCKRNQIIKIDPLSVRKRSRYRRPERIKKP